VTSIQASGKVFNLILVAAEQEERAHRRIRIGTVEDDALGDAEAAAQRDRVGWAPAGGGERVLDVRLAADERDVQRVARHPVRCAAELRRIRHRRQLLVVAPEGRQDEVGERKIDPDGQDHPAGEA